MTYHERLMALARKVAAIEARDLDTNTRRTYYGCPLCGRDCTDEARVNSDPDFHDEDCPKAEAMRLLKDKEMDDRTKALLVLVLDRRHRAWLEENDPMALKQAEAALRADPEGAKALDEAAEFGRRNADEAQDDEG